MAKAIQLASPSAGARPVLTVQTFRQPSPDPVARQAAIENALSMALHFVRQPGESAANLWAATARANRALTLLKQASEGVGHTSSANVAGRA